MINFPQNLHNPLCCTPITVDVFAGGTVRAEGFRSGFRDGTSNCVSIVGGIEDVPRTETSLLAVADVHDGKME